MEINVIEIRDYLLKPNTREHFIDYFEFGFIGALRDEDVYVMGQFRLVGEPDHIVWLRGFADMPTRKQGLERFYTSAFWKQRAKVINDMILDIENCHLVCPLLPLDVLGGNSAEQVTAALAAGRLTTDVSLVAFDFYHALPGQRDALLTTFQTRVMPVCAEHGIPVRGVFGAEMSENTYPRLPVIQDADELVVMTTYKNEASAKKLRAKATAEIKQAFDHLLARPTDTMLLHPTLRSPLRYTDRFLAQP